MILFIFLKFLVNTLCFMKLLTIKVFHWQTENGVECSFGQQWLLKLYLNNQPLMFLSSPLQVHHCACYQNACQGNVQKGMPFHKSCRPILKDNPGFYFLPEFCINLCPGVMGIFCEALHSWTQIHCKNAKKEIIMYLWKRLFIWSALDNSKNHFRTGFSCVS